MENNKIIYAESLKKILATIEYECKSDEVSEMQKKSFQDLVYWLMREVVPELIDKMPAADAEPVRHGQWREISAHRDYDGDILRDYECSECLGIIRDVPDVWQSENFSLDRYCAMCGALMDGGGDHGEKK